MPSDSLPTTEFYNGLHQTKPIEKLLLTRAAFFVYMTLAKQGIDSKGMLSLFFAAYFPGKDRWQAIYLHFLCLSPFLEMQ